MPRLKQTRVAAENGTRRAASIQDVAAAAQVSTATVSRVLNAPGLVAPGTAVRVERAIKALGYRPNRFAQGLTTRRSRVLGIALPDIHGEFYSELLRGADAEARRHGYHLLVSSEARVAPQDGEGASGGGPSRSLAFGLIDGLAIMLTEPNEVLWRETRQLGLPVVLLDAEVGPDGSGDVDTVLVDDEAGAREATEHLLRGTAPDRCYFVGGPRGNFDTQRRARAFADVLRATGAPPRADQIDYGRYDVEWGRAWVVGQLRGRGLRASAVLAGNDEVALGVLHAAQAAGIDVPGDLRIVGFDDTRLASLVRPSLSTVRIPLAEIGAAAIKRLVQRIEGAAEEVTSVRLIPRLIVRDSSAGPGRSRAIG